MTRDKDVLFIGGSDFMRRVNHRGHHVVASLEERTRRVDVVALRAFYDGPRPAGPLKRLRGGLKDYLHQPVEETERASGTQWVVRKLPSTLDPYVQDLWAYLHLGGLARRHYDLGIFGNPDNVLLAWLLKRRGIVETLVYDDWDYYAGFEAPPHWRLPMAWRERFCISIADTVISVGHLLAEQRVEQGAKRAVVVPNGVDYPLFALGQQKRPHPPTLIYMGSIEDWTGLGVAVEGFAHVHSRIPLARFLILGPDGNPYGRALRERVGELGLAEHVLFLGYKPYHELPEFLAEADIGVALFAPSELTRYAFPLKVVEYMAAGLPVLGTRAGETGRAIRESGAGEALDCSAEAFACAAVELLGDPMRLAEYGKRGREYARGYDWEALFPRFHEAVGLGNSQGPSKE